MGSVKVRTKDGRIINYELPQYNTLIKIGSRIDVERWFNDLEDQGYDIDAMMDEFRLIHRLGNTYFTTTD